MEKKGLKKMKNQKNECIQAVEKQKKTFLKKQKNKGRNPTHLSCAPSDVFIIYDPATFKINFQQ